MTDMMSDREFAAMPMPSGQNPGPVRHPHPQPRLSPPKQDTVGDTTHVHTGEGIFAELDPFTYPPGTNLLPTVYTNIFDSAGHEVINTLPSTPTRPYNLHGAEPEISTIPADSPGDDLDGILNRLPELLTGESAREYWGRFGDRAHPDDIGAVLPADRINAGDVREALTRAIDILQGDPVPGRAYSGFPLLHYRGPDKIRKVQPIRDDRGRIIGGNVDVHQVWYGGHIESDTSYLDLTELTGPDGAFLDVGWTVTYTVDVLNRGRDDFSPMTMYFDSPGMHSPLAPPVPNGVPPAPNVAMDQTFHPMTEGSRTVFVIKMAPPRYYNLTYTWGWRLHPPRVQVMENASKKFPPHDMPGMPSKPLPRYEIDVFGNKTPEQAIDMISDLAPAKRMWTAFRAARQALDTPDAPDYEKVLRQTTHALSAFRDWRDRNHLPSGLKPDPDADLTLLYVNNTIYGQFTDGGWNDFPKWRTRGAAYRVTLLNGDYFEHGYLNVDFGGGRGWENQFKPTVKYGGTGSQFSFGRFYWDMNMAQPIILPPAGRQDGITTPSRHKVEFIMNFEPSRRLRFYQFDPLHHDVAIYSLH